MPRSVLMTLYKAFLIPRVDYGDVIYDECYNEKFNQVLKSVQYNARPALSGGIRVSPRKIWYQELDLDSL